MTLPLTKDPGDTLDYEEDWTAFVGALIISSSAWTVPTGITKVSDSHTDTAATIRLSGGADGVDYRCVNAITMSNGQIANRSITVRVRVDDQSRTPFDDPASAFQKDALTDGEIDRVREIVQTEALSTITTLCGDLSNVQNQAMRYDLDQFFNKVGEGTVRMEKGRDGIDFSQQRNRTEIRQRVRARLNLPGGFSSGGLFQINVTGQTGNQSAEY